MVSLILHCCLILANGSKLGDSTSQFYVATSEPYAVCCIEGESRLFCWTAGLVVESLTQSFSLFAIRVGLKVSFGMHKFGGKRWGEGLVDDFRSVNDVNNRVVGDFTKSVDTLTIVEKMHEVRTVLVRVWRRGGGQRQMRSKRTIYCILDYDTHTHHCLVFP